MITITERALTWLSRIDAPSGRALRLEPDGDRSLRLTFGRARLRDQVIRRDGRDVVRIPRAVSETFDGAALDLRDGHQHGGLILRRPATAVSPGRYA